MNVNGGTSRPLFTAIKLPKTTWVGPNPLGSGFCYGSEDGVVSFADFQGKRSSFLTIRSHSREAINGVARVGEWVALSTRDDVSIVNVVKKKRRAAVLPQGTHGIVAAPGGYFVAPLGRQGILAFKPGPANQHSAVALEAKSGDTYYYRIVAARGSCGKDILACACRLSGIGVTEFAWGQQSYSMRLAAFEGLDVIDVCVIKPKAVAAVGRDGTLIFLRDWQDKQPLTVKFNSVEGTVYRLLSSREHLFILTSRGLYGLMKLGSSLVQGMPLGEVRMDALVLPMEAVDANTVNGRYLLVVMPDEIRRFDMTAMEAATPENLQAGEIREAGAEMLDRPWKFSDGAERSMELVPCG